MAQKPLLARYLSEQTASIDAQIADIQASNTSADKMKTKRGNVSSSGRVIMINNSATLADLQASRKEIVSNATIEFNTKLKDMESASVSKGNFFTRFGGWGEIGEILFCLLLGLTEAINRNSNKERLGNHPTPPNDGERRYDPENQNTTRRDHVQAYRSRSNTAAENCVTSDTTVSQNLNISVDDILKHGRTSLLREIANLKNDSGKTKTVAYRIYGILNRVGRFASQKNFEPSDEVIVSFFTVLNDSLQALKEKGMPYEYENQITRQFEKLLPEQEMTA
jgi:chorismate mutase